MTPSPNSTPGPNSAATIGSGAALGSGAAPAPWSAFRPTALLVLADGTVLEGVGVGATGSVAAELVFNTAMTGYQEILTDPSYKDQIVTFTFPHVGNVGANEEDGEDLSPAARHGAVGAVFRETITDASSFRAREGLDAWLAARGIIALTGVDTRALTARLRDGGAVNAVIAHEPSGTFDREALVARARDWHGLVGLDLARPASTREPLPWSETPWTLGPGFGASEGANAPHVVAIDYGTKRNILRNLAGAGLRVTVMPGDASAAGILAREPDGVFLSNGPGDPAATAAYAVPVIQELLERDIPIFGICLGHQLLALALGGRTLKMALGHHGANHPVRDMEDGHVEIVSMNHGFAVDASSLPSGVVETHRSLFDGSNCGLAVKDRPVFSVQHHPEASPGPHDSLGLFARFASILRERQA